MTTELPIVTILGNVPSKSNSYKIVTIKKKKKGGKDFSKLAKTDELLAYENLFYAQCIAYRNKFITSEFELHAKVYFHWNLCDIDNSLKIVLDCLQDIKAIRNDRNCAKVVVEKFIDKQNPRIEFFIKERTNVS